MKIGELPKTLEDKRKWFEHYTRVDVIAHILNNERCTTFDDITKDELMTLFLAKCAMAAEDQDLLTKMTTSNNANAKNFEASQREVRNMHQRIADAQDLCKSQAVLQSENMFLRGLVEKLTDREFSFEDSGLKFKLGSNDKKVEPS